jgi:hypothetical protein
VVKLPWAEASSRFTALFEARAIEGRKEASQKAVARQRELSWEEIQGIMERAVERGLERRQAEKIAQIGIEEKAFRKGPRYVTLGNAVVRGQVLYVAEGREQSSLDGFWGTLRGEQLGGIEAVAMDRWDPYVRSVREPLPGADGKIVFDKFHMAKHLGEGVYQVRRRENKTLKAAGDDRLAGTRYDGLKNPAAMEPATAHDRGGADPQAPLREHHHLPAASRDERGQRVPQREDPMGEVPGAGIPQPPELHPRHLLPLRWARPCPSYPLKCRKSGKMKEYTAQMDSLLGATAAMRSCLRVREDS